jgi:hypothetical protein
MPPKVVVYGSPVLAFNSPPMIPPKEKGDKIAVEALVPG